MLSKIKFPVIGIVIGCLLSFLAVKAPSMHLKFLRNRVGSAVTMLVTLDQTSGGTGFQIKALSGNEYIITNKHVCAGREALLAINNGEMSYNKVIAVDEEHDICVVKPSPLLNSIRIGSDPDVGDQIAIVGHPFLTPMQVSRGEINGFNRALRTGFPELPLFVPTYWSSAHTYPGNSGSPVVDFYGNVVGILFAGMSDHINLIVPISSLEEFLIKNKL